jgi:hypothetical protein
MYSRKDTPQAWGYLVQVVSGLGVGKVIPFVESALGRLFNSSGKGVMMRLGAEETGRKWLDSCTYGGMGGKNYLYAFFGKDEFGALRPGITAEEVKDAWENYNRYFADRNKIYTWEAHKKNRVEVPLKSLVSSEILDKIVTTPTTIVQAQEPDSKLRLLTNQMRAMIMLLAMDNKGVVCVEGIGKFLDAALGALTTHSQVITGSSGKKDLAAGFSNKNNSKLGKDVWVKRRVAILAYIKGNEGAIRVKVRLHYTDVTYG